MDTDSHFLIACTRVALSMTFALRTSTRKNASAVLWDSNMKWKFARMTLGLDVLTLNHSTVGASICLEVCIHIL